MRKAKPKKRVILPDPVFNDQKVSKFVNHLMYDGKKNTSYEIFYNALDIVKAKMSNEEKSALEIWKQALDNITPQVEVKSRRIGGATFQVPTEIRSDRKESISMKNLIIFARKRGGKTMADKLAAEIMDAYNNQGGAFKRKEDMHRMAEADTWQNPIFHHAGQIRYIHIAKACYRHHLSSDHYNYDIHRYHYGR